MRRLVSLALTLAAVAACSSETIVVGEVPVVDAGVSAPPPTRCVDSSTCASGYYCSLSSCGASSGTCLPPPVNCDATEAPVCGCDGITYFNDCWRQAYGIAASTPNPCEEPGCGGPTGTTCPSGTFCALLTSPHEPCGHDLPGTCWVLPPHCPTAVPTNAWDSCEQPGGICLDTCDAIKAGGVYRRSENCPP